MRILRVNNSKLQLILATIFLFGVLSSYTITTVTALTGKIILVDAGHGGIDPGANRPGVLEKDINLAVALQLKEILNHYGAKVILTRESDEDLSGLCDNDQVKGRYRRDLAARLEMVEESDIDVFISIHANAARDTSRRGAESFYYSKSVLSQSLATCILAELSKVTKAAPLAAPANYFVLKHNKVPAALIEVGYITNTEERALLQTSKFQRQLAEAVAKGIHNYYHHSF